VLPLADIECPHINPEMVLAVKNQVIRRID